MKLAVIDLEGPAEATSQAIHHACRELGFFYAVGTGIDKTLCADLDDASRRFFARPRAEKMELRMERGGRAWRGYFPVGAELTAGVPDRKEGLYLGEELDESHPKVASGVPLHGKNLFPSEPPELRQIALEYIREMTALGHRLMERLSQSLSLPPSYFSDHYTADPLVLFRIFNYPALPLGEGDVFSVGEHTDYGLLTILLQDDCGGLQVRTPSGWVDVPPVEGSFVVNLGDMIELLTGGLYASTPHRVRNESGRSRLSFPFFFDPSWDAVVRPVPSPSAGRDDGSTRWDGRSVHDFDGTYGEYLERKISKVFPRLKGEVL